MESSAHLTKVEIFSRGWQSTQLNHLHTQLCPCCNSLPKCIINIVLKRRHRLWSRPSDSGTSGKKKWHGLLAVSTPSILYSSLHCQSLLWLPEGGSSAWLVSMETELNKPCLWRREKQDALSCIWSVTKKAQRTPPQSCSELQIPSTLTSQTSEMFTFPLLLLGLDIDLQ